MNIEDLKALFRWVNWATLDADFWERIWYAADAYPPTTRALLRGFVASFGIVPE